MNEHTIQAAEIIWEYMQVKDEAGDADCLVVLGSRNDRVATYAAQLIKTYYYRMVIITGESAHHNDLLATHWKETTEAEHFEAVIQQAGITRDILLETEALNTRQNATYSYRMLQEMGYIPVWSLLIVTKPYMERRAKATFEAQWPGETVPMHVTSSRQSLMTYVDDVQPLDTVIAIMVGDMERIIKYPKRGFQSVQVVLGPVMSAYEQLVKDGFTQHILGST